MKFRVEVVCVGEEGDEARGEVLTLERHHLAMDTLGLTLRESKAMLVGVQDFVIAHQAAEDLTQRRPCPSCGRRHTTKGGGATAVKTLFGVVPVVNPRWYRCPCQGHGPKTFRRAASWLVGQTSPELLYVETKWASLIPFAKVAELLHDVAAGGGRDKPRDDPPPPPGHRPADGGRVGRRAPARRVRGRAR